MATIQADTVSQMIRPRRYSHERRARLSECAPDGRLRLDSLACWLQDVAWDDVAESGLVEQVWLVRRTRIHVARWPRLYEKVEISTWASGAGRSVAERRTVIGGGMAEATALWVCVDPKTLRPRQLSDSFHEIYGTSAQGHRPSARLTHPDPPAGATAHRWTPRVTDLDRLGHVNNAAYLGALEELVAEAPDSSGDGRPPSQVEIEYRSGLVRGDATLMLVNGYLYFVQLGKVAASIALLEECPDRSPEE
jgi:acyl-ACP thioesterase